MKKSFLKSSVASLAIVFASHAAFAQGEVTRESEMSNAWGTLKDRIALENENAIFKKQKIQHQYGGLPEPTLVLVGETLLPLWDSKGDADFVSSFNKRTENVDKRLDKRKQKAVKAYERQVKRIDRKYD